MAGKFGEIVAYNNGERDIPAIVQAADGTYRDLVFQDTDTGAGEIRKHVPRRDPEDYEKGGGGGQTWHPIS